MASHVRPLLRQARRNAGLTQQALADLVGARQPTIAAYERGRQLPRVDTAVRLAAALSTTVEAIWPPEDDDKKRASAGATAPPVSDHQEAPDGQHRAA